MDINRITRQRVFIQNICTFSKFVGQLASSLGISLINAGEPTPSRKWNRLYAHCGAVYLFIGECCLLIVSNHDVIEFEDSLD